MCCTEAPGLYSGERSFVCIHAEYICNPAPLDNKSVRLHPIETPKEDSRMSPKPCPAIQHNNLKKLRVVKPLIAAVIRVGVMCGSHIRDTTRQTHIAPSSALCCYAPPALIRCAYAESLHFNRTRFSTYSPEASVCRLFVCHSC